MTRSRRTPGDSREWTDFEINIILALICKGDHLTSSIVDFTTKVNEALNGKRPSDYEEDISVADVRRLMSVMEKNKKAAFAFIERQPHPKVLTRTKKRAFQRDIPFDGSLKEWHLDGRKELFDRASLTMRSRGMQSTFTNAQGVQIERWVPSSNRDRTREIDSSLVGDSFTVPCDAERGLHTEYGDQRLQASTPTLTMSGGLGASLSLPSTPIRGYLDPLLAGTPFSEARFRTNPAGHQKDNTSPTPGKPQAHPHPHRQTYGRGLDQQMETSAGVDEENQDC